MCGRFTVTDPARIIARFPRFEFRDEFVASYNVAPTQNIPGVMNAAPEEIVAFRWGLIPPWAKDERVGFSTINARAETISESRMYRMPLRRRRCLLFADGFLEWRMSGKIKQPVHFRMVSREPFAFAGLYEYWTHPDGRNIRSATIIVTSANSVVAEVHDRMPVILPESSFDMWLCNDDIAPEMLERLLQPYDPRAMVAIDVDPMINKVANNSPECLKPVTELQPPLMLGLS